MSSPRTLAQKVWDDHLVVKGENGNPDLIYTDLHLVHEVTSPQAFDGLRMAGRPVRRLDHRARSVRSGRRLPIGVGLTGRSLSRDGNRGLSRNRGMAFGRRRVRLALLRLSSRSWRR